MRPRAVRRFTLAGVVLSVAAALAACEHPVALTSAHVEAMDVILRDTTGVELARTVDNAEWAGGALQGSVRAPTAIAVSFLDIHGNEFDLGARPDASLRVETRPEGGATWEHFGRWGLLHPTRSGAMQLRFIVWHIDHPDLVTPWITLESSLTDAS
ncbi:hypothetical protein [Gaopeijia maritima]|uniref:Uncharacterized protein n=1 Tax=Gaopeijia maritima TaxID=3119007 RepID=A0ABU9EAN7_9BACT